MPLHRHECESCGHRFRILVPHGTENDAPTCPECGSRSTRRMMPLVAVQFKGSGFYKTDHGRKDRSRPAKTGTDGDAKSTGRTDSSPSESGSNDSASSSAGSDASGAPGPKAESAAS